MKVLLVTHGWHTDYLTDSITHGLYTLLGEDLTHTEECRYMYRDLISKDHLFLGTYGRGFTLSAILPKYLNDNSDLENKIKNKYFDYIVYGTIQNCRTYLPLVLEHYPKNKIIKINTDDGPYFDSLEFDDGVPYFKRELFEYTHHKNLFPISYTFPEEKIVKNPQDIKKERFIAEYIPRFTNGYIYENEEDYYKGYQISNFGLTTRKAGWDCMRHYEILANYCMPYFPDLKDCPEPVMHNFPKKEILRANELYKKFNEQEYYDLLNTVFEHTKTHLTTTASIKYILDTVNKHI